MGNNIGGTKKEYRDTSLFDSNNNAARTENRRNLPYFYLSMRLSISVLELFVKVHYQGVGEAGARPFGFIYFILGKAFLFSRFQMHFEAKK